MIERAKEARLCAAALAAACASCITVTTVNIGQKTSLERQLIGDFEPLTEEDLLASSVRAEGGVERGSLGDVQQRAIAARRRQLFNRDDIEELKAKGCLGEAPRAIIAARPCQAEDPQAERRAARLIAEENQDRRTIIAWAIQADPVLTPADRPQVVALYTRLLREQLAVGHWRQTDEGEWVQKQADAQKKP